MNRRSFIISSAGFTGGLTALLGTGAFSASRMTDREVDVSVVNDASGLVGLIPNDDLFGVNLVDGKLAISMADGEPATVNVNSVYQFGAFVEEESTIEDGITNEAFDPLRAEYPDKRDESEEFASAFLVVNQTDNEQNIEFEFVQSESTSDGTNFAFEAHYNGEVEDSLTFPADKEDNNMMLVEQLNPGEAFGVSFAVNALDGELGDGFSAKFSVTAGEPVSIPD